ncbi:hypothetical protein V6N13_072839 [Hibiscus sabdariffa]|uniref:Uncharacterized protein n=1 Tax=Hibiscus sabdariffa TaxID=183260 RepID=A0ABR2E7C1_9ROSI
MNPKEEKPSSNPPPNPPQTSSFPSPFMELEMFSSATVGIYWCASAFASSSGEPGFRKIDTNKCEFANEAFQRGKRHLLKNIQRRKSLQSQQEVVELQQGTARHVEVVNKRLQSAEQRQKQMVSFLAKLFQNPAFLAHLRQKKELGEIGSLKMRRKFVKHQTVELIDSETPAEGQIVKYDRPDWRNIFISSPSLDINTICVEPSPDYLPRVQLESIWVQKAFIFQLMMT